MGIDYLVLHAWAGPAAWAAVYISDYYLTLWAARIYRRSGQQFIEFEQSYELNPLFQRDVNALRPVSWTFIRMLGLTSGLLVALWFLTVAPVGGLPIIYEFMLGGWLLLQVAVHSRHAENLATFRLIELHGGVAGKIQYAYWFSLRVSAAQFLIWSLIYAVIGVLTWRLFFLGGTVMCCRVAIQHRAQSKRARTQAKARGGGDSNSG